MMKKNTGQRGRMLPLLLSFLALMMMALFVTRWFLFRKPPPPPASATAQVKLQYWQDRITKDVSDKEAYLQLGLLEEKTELYSSARRHLGSARALGVEDTSICAPLGRVLIQLGQSEEALKELEKSVALHPNEWEPLANLAGLYVNERHKEKANELLIHFWKNIEKKILDQNALERLLLAFQAVDNMVAALEVGKYLVTRYPNNSGGFVLAAQCAFTLKDIPLAKQYTEMALKETPDDSAALYFHGLVLREAKDYDGALVAWQKANKINPKATDVYERIGEEYARRGDFKRAASALEFVALKDQSLPSAIRTGIAYSQAKMPEEADYWQSVTAGLQGNFPRALTIAQSLSHSANPMLKRRGMNAIAEAYRGMKKKPEYLAAVLEATKEGTAADWRERARAYNFLQQPLQYIACLYKIMEKDPKQEAAIRYQVGTELAKIGETDKAETELAKVVSLEPNNADFLLELAKLYMRRSNVGDRLQKATKLAEQATSLAPQEHSAWLLLGQCYAGQNNLKQAARCIEHSIDIEAGNGPAYLELSRVYARAGNQPASQEAMKQYQKYATFDMNLQTLRTKARRPHATVPDIVAYADAALEMGDNQEGMTYYEKAYVENPQDKSLLKILQSLYQKLQIPEREKHLEQMVKQPKK
jgi:tetratricopeptide (TPR) repeat protein